MGKNQGSKFQKFLNGIKKIFGRNKDLALFLSKYRNNPDEKKFLEEKAGKISISYFDYDWSLNK